MMPPSFMRALQAKQAALTVFVIDQRQHRWYALNASSRLGGRMCGS